MRILGRMMFFTGWPAALLVWAYEARGWLRGGAWQPLPFHQILSGMHMLPRDLYVWSYCSSLSAEKHREVPFCADVSTAMAGLGRTLWLCLASEGGSVIAVATLLVGGLALVVGSDERIVRTPPKRFENWPEPPPPPQSESPTE
jgi:hypothetical protein